MKNEKKYKKSLPLIIDMHQNTSQVSHKVYDVVLSFALVLLFGYLLFILVHYFLCLYFFYLYASLLLFVVLSFVCLCEGDVEA